MYPPPEKITILKNSHSGILWIHFPFNTHHFLGYLCVIFREVWNQKKSNQSWMTGSSGRDLKNRAILHPKNISNLRSGWTCRVALGKTDPGGSTDHSGDLEKMDPLVGGFSPTHLKNMRTVKILDHLPKDPR